MLQALKDKVCIVTGAASGIGRACAELLIREECRVVLADLDGDGAEAALIEVAEGTDATRSLALAVDVTSEADTQRLAQTTLDRFGRIDALVAAAGILRMGGTLKTVADTPIDEWNAVINTNLTGTFLCNRAVLGAMLAQGEGDIVNISSTSGKQGRPFDGPYSASKFGIIGLSESLSEEVSGRGIRVQTLLPDAVATPLWLQNGPAAMKPANTLPPARVAELVAYLIAMPRDALLFNPVLMPMKTRRRRKS